MAENIYCNTHGERTRSFACTHLSGDSAGLGFNCEEPTDNNPFPDAWCDDCDLIYQAHGGWTEESQALVHISLLCSGCYERTRIRNTHPEVTLESLADLRWQCGSCEEWHRGPCLDFGHSRPFYWSKANEEANRQASKVPSQADNRAKTFLTHDYCAIDNTDFFVRGLINIPIIGTRENLRWGVWGSLSRGNFETLLSSDDDTKRTELPPMFSWLSTRIEGYPETLNMKMYAHIQEPGSRPHFELEATDHPLSLEYRNGIAPQQVKEIMMRRLASLQ